MSTIPDPLIGLILIILAVSVILSLTIYSLIQVVFLGRKRYVIGPKLSKGQDTVLSGADLSRDMTVTQATMTGVGAMIGAGIFVLTGIAAGIAGPGLLVAFAFNGVIATLIAMVYAELGSAIPEAGGGYIWARAGLGERQGFLTGWMSWFAAAVAGSLYALGFAAYFVALLGNLGVNIPSENIFFIEKIIAVIAIILFLVINQFGSSVMGKAEIWISGIKVIVLVFFILTGLIIITSNPSLASSNFSNFFPRGFFSIFTAMGFTFIAFEGYEVVCQAGEEIYDPKTSVPKSVILSVLIVIPIYLLVGVVSLGAFTVEGQATWQFLSENKELGLLFAAQQMLPGLGLVVILFGGILSTLSALNAVLFSSTRVAFALARHGSLPPQLAAVSAKTHTPVNSIYMTGLVVILMAVLIPIEAVATSADLMFMMLFGQVMIAAILIRRKVRVSKEKLDYGYKTPLFPLIPVLGGLALFLIFSFTIFLHLEALVTTLIWLVLGEIVYEGYARRRISLRVPSKLAKHARPRANYIPEAFFTTVLNNILVPVRGRSFEWDTIRIAIHIAHEFGPKVTLYHFGFKTKDSFSDYTDEFKRFRIPYEVKIVAPSHKNISSRDIIQHMIEVASTGEYQLAILPSRRKRKFGQISVSHNALRKMPIPGLQVFPGKKEIIEKKLTFEHVGALTPGSKRDPFLIQLGIAMVSSTRIADLVAYHWTHVPKLITPKVMSEAPGVQENISIFLHTIGEALRMGIPIEQRHVLGHDFVKSIAEVVKKDQLELLILGYGKPRLGRRPSEKLVQNIDCTAVVFHGRPFYQIREGSTPSF
ncbi:MAG: amino acid permease [Candidatus Heimdallarchaeota archaeon]|nr:MAG: amino acid permease [Candidatus Heimdallarchaeota archaeon]